MEKQKNNGIEIKNEHNEFELALRFLGNGLIAIKLAATNFSGKLIVWSILCLLYTSPSPRDGLLSRMPSSA